MTRTTLGGMVWSPVTPASWLAPQVKCSVCVSPTIYRADRSLFTNWPAACFGEATTTENPLVTDKSSDERVGSQVVSRLGVMEISHAQKLKSTPLCARLISPGCGGLPPPTKPASLTEWCGERNGRRDIKGSPGGSSPIAL